MRGLSGVIHPHELTAIVNTADDLIIHGLRVAPDLDSVTYWLAGLADRDRGWGRAGDTFRTTGALRSLGAEEAWFSLGDLDMATHLFRTGLLAAGHPLSEATRTLARRLGVGSRILPMTDQPVTTRLRVTIAEKIVDLHFQEYWVKRGAADPIESIRYEGADDASPAPGVMEAIAGADAILICPSNPIASIGPILAVPGIRDAMAARRERVAGVSPIVSGAPLSGMADKLLPVAGVEVSAAGVAGHYAGLLSGWVMDRADAALAGRVQGAGIRAAVTDTIMVDDLAARSLARVALELAAEG